MDDFDVTRDDFDLAVLLRCLPGTLSPLCGGRKLRRPTTAAQFLDLVEARNPTIQYSRAASKKRECTECAVCLSEFEEGEELRRLLCGHTFHKGCLDTWLQQRLATCPLCRSKVLPDDVAAGFHHQQMQSSSLRPEYDGSDEELVFLLSAIHGNSLHRFL
ncbi:hypothetical protein CRG98_034336 [Punica granatum]|uniref:RING-type domain-containing protein n=1 Tax=Punica granatum TaxID=22663 RepID=A0A2I0IP94_PUNGR|nr:hypothetical protein CRG98_034336 [Punica granatum]